MAITRMLSLAVAVLVLTSSAPEVTGAEAEWVRDDGAVDSAAQLPELESDGNGEHTELSAECKQAYERLELENQSAVLTAMIDSWGKPGPGILNGDVDWYGDYLQCTSLTESKYCVSTFTINASAMQPPIPIRLGLCVPKECSDEDAFNFPRYFENATDNAKMSEALSVLSSNLVEYSSNLTGWCSNPMPYSTGSILSLTLVAILLVLLLIGTFIDWFFFNDMQSQGTIGVLNVNKFESSAPFNGFGGIGNAGETSVTKRTPSSELGRETLHERSPLLPSLSQSPEYRGPRKMRRLLELLRCFSVPRKLNIILAAKHKPGTIPSLHGLRVFSMFWVILGHSYMWPLLVGEANVVYAMKITQRVSFQFVLNGTFSVDTFFFLSGLLVMFLTLKHLEKNGQVKWHLFYIHRYLRLTPLYMFIILAFIYLVPYFVQTPMSSSPALNATVACKKYWWTNMLYIQNFYPGSLEAGCLGWGWYLANDMQFFIISPLVILAAYRFRALGVAVACGGLVAVSLVTRAVLADHNHIYLSGMNNPAMAGAQKKVEDILYEKPYTRVATYAIGMAVGYMVRRVPHRVASMPRTTRVVLAITGWLLVAVLLCAPLYSLSDMYASETKLSLTASVAYQTLSRISWGLGLACLVLLCHSGYGGYVNSILSHPMWIPLSRLTYGAYLVHPIVLTILFQCLDKAVYFTDAAAVFYYVSAVTVAYLAALVCAAGLEYPLLELESSVLSR